MRRLMWFSIGFALGCGLCAYALPEKWIIPLAVLTFLPGLAAGILGRNYKTPRRIGWTLVGCALGLGWFMTFRQLYLLPAIAADGETVSATVTATDYSYDTTYGTAVDGTVELEGKTYQIRLYINEKKTIEPGDVIEGSFRFRITTPDGEKGATYHQGKGIFLLGYQTDTVQVVRAVTDGLMYLPAVLRGGIEDIIRSCFPEDTFGFAQALLLGDSTELDYETETAFKVSGIRHIIAVSGLHVSILYGLLSAVTFKRRYLTALLGLPLLGLFAAVAGFTPSVVRACIMVGLMILATAINREYDGPTELGFAALVMLVVNPMVITSVGFQLSVASVAGIFLFNPPIREWLKTIFGEPKGKTLTARLNRWFCGSISTTLSAISLTTPLCAYYFGTVSLVGILTNLLTLWAVSFIFYGIIAVCLVYLLSFSVAKFLAGAISWLIRYVLAVAKFCAGLPLAAVYTKSIYIVLWLVFVYLLLAVFLVSKRKKPLRLICCGILGLCIALVCSWTEPLMDECRLTVLDVGQGQSILLQSQGRTYLVDCGGDDAEETADLVAETLLSQGISRLDGIILTHFDDDHAAGVPYLLTRIDTDCVLIPDIRDDGAGDRIASCTDGAVLRVWDDLSLTFGEAGIRIFGPFYTGNGNENSMCVLFESENCAILITGDRSAFGERMLLRQGELPRVDVLIAGHHGSKTSTSEELLDAVRPDTVIISVGENSYGHPSAEVLARLEKYGCTVYRTDESGTIIYRR